MPEYYNVQLNLQDTVEKIYDLTSEELGKKIIAPYENGTDLFVNGRNIDSYEIERIHIIQIDRKTGEILKNLKQEDARKNRELANSGIIWTGRSPTKEVAFWKGENVLDKFISGAPGYKKTNDGKNSESKNNRNMNKNKIFIVHGHNEEMKQSVARFIEKLNLSPIILHEQTNSGNTIIEKFEEHSDVNYALVLLSGDDYGFIKTSNVKKKRLRPRQNVILELGYFVGKIGRKNVSVLYEQKANLEIPSDVSGLMYISYDNSESWKLKVAKELKSVGYKIDGNKLLEF